MRLGTRRSRLAMTQSGMIARALGSDVVLVGIDTEGDRIVDAPLRGPLAKGFFTEALEAELRAGSIDLAVHSLKDLPVAQPSGLVVAAIPARAGAADLLLVRPDAFDDAGGPLPLHPGAKVGSTSPRRQALLRAWGREPRVEDLRGNVTTRVQRLRDGRFDAILLAEAGLRRLGAFDAGGEVDLRGLRVLRLATGHWPPAPGQGALAVQCRADDAPTLERIAALHHPPTASDVLTERAWLQRLGGGCALPFGARVDGKYWSFILGRSDGVVLRSGMGLDAGLVALGAAIEGGQTTSLTEDEPIWEELDAAA